ncbi:acyltransferase family protein [Glutamicibacter endophyticus]
MQRHVAAKRPEKVARLGLLDGLRITAALTVVFYHYTAWGHSHWGTKAPDAWPILSEITRYGSIGVQLFFLISGFVILMSVQGKSVLQFVASRAGRLYPAYWLAVLAAAVLTFILWPEASDGRTTGDILPNLTMMQTAMDVRDLDGVYWTLWAELRFYFLLGIMLALGWTKSHHIMLLSVLWPAVGLYFKFTGATTSMEWVLGQYSSLFCIGMLLFVIYTEGSSLTRWLLIGVNTLIASYHTGLKGAFDSSYLSGLEVPAWHFALLCTLCVAVVALCTVTPLNRVYSRWLVFAGSLTYPLYLIHELWGWWIIESLHLKINQYILLPLTIAIVLLVAYLISRFVEKPAGLLLRNRILAAGGKLGQRIALPVPSWARSDIP